MFTASDVETVEQVATGTALRLDNLRLSARHAATVRTLGEALLPVVPQVLTGVQMEAGYRAARRGDGVGEDWPGCRVAGRRSSWGT